MSDFLFYAGVVGFCLGVALETLFGFGLPVATWTLLLASVGALLWRRGGGASTPFLLISIFFLTFAIGTVRLQVSSWGFESSPLGVHVDQEVNFDGVVVREPDVRERTQHLYVETNDETVLVFTDRYGQYSYGDSIEITGTLERPESFETDLGRTFNYPGYLQAQGVQYVIPFGEVVVTEAGGGNQFVVYLLTFKQRFMTAIESVLPEPEVGLAEGLLLGVKQALGDDLERVFRETGIIHIVVLSGYNVALVVAFVMYVISYFLPYRFRLGFGILAIVSFALMVGLSATVVRASLMAVFILLAKSLGRTYAVLRGLMVAGLIMLFINPYLLVYDVGFQLSFLATMGLILLAPQLERFVGWMPTVFGLREFLLATIATQLFVLPILLYQIGEFSVVSVLVNVLVLPMVPVAMLLTFSTGLITLFIPVLSTPLVYVTSWSLSYILGVASWFATLPFAAFTVPAFSFWLVPIAYAVLGYAWWKLLTTENISDPLRAWTIEEESVLRERLEKGSVSKETPVYFK